MFAQAKRSAAGFVQQLAVDLNDGNLELPMFPDSVIRLQRVFQAEDLDLDEVARIISSDPTLVTRVLQVSNSAALRAAQEINEIWKECMEIAARCHVITKTGV